MTYLQLVNDVLARLREDSVATVTATSYSALIGKFVNDAKRQVEDAWNWDALSTTIATTTVSGTSSYTLTGIGTRFKDAVINDTTNKVRLLNVPIQWIIDQQELSTAQTGNPSYYAFNGFSGGDAKIELYPTPNGSFSLSTSVYVPQTDLSSDDDVLTVQSEAVVLGAYARALVERGEDGGLSSSEAYQMFKNVLADQIAIESGRFVENSCWVAV